MLSGAAQRQRMTMRAYLERDTNARDGATKDAYNNPLAPDWHELATVPCFVWTQPYARNNSPEVVETSRAIVNDRVLAMFPTDTDMTERDRVASIKNRKGDVLFPGPLNIRGLKNANGWIEATMELATA